MKKSESIINIALKRGFFFPTAEIYGAKSGFWTYGHLGTLMKRKFENLWRTFFLNLQERYYEIEGNCILPEKVFEASGHLKNFQDPMTNCVKCKFRFRADQLVEDELKKDTSGLTETNLDTIIKKHKLKCPNCGGDLEKVRMFNMMFEVRIGASGSDDLAYLSPETAQNAFLSFKKQFMSLREKLPIGLAIIGRAFRNEISPRQGFFRLREFTQAELQIFFDPERFDDEIKFEDISQYTLIVADEDGTKTSIKCIDAIKNLHLPKFYVYHLAKIQQFYLDVLGIDANRFRLRKLKDTEKAFYNKLHFDVEIDIETLGGFKEVAGLHYRTDHDLKGHEKISGEKLEIVNNGRRFIPHVLELSFGVDRNIWMLMDLSYYEDKERTLFRFNRNIAPIEVAVFPLVNKDGLPEKAFTIYKSLSKKFSVLFDSSGSIGRMYRRVDEIGVVAMITVDYETLKDDTVTIRNRDSMKQVRLKTGKLYDALEKFFGGKKFGDLGKSVD